MDTSAMLDRLTMGELEQFEKISGLPMDEMGSPGTPKAGLLIALAYIAARRNGTGETLEDIRALPVSKVEGIVETVLGVEDEPDPT
ncbi:hypothetical protein, partial [Streptococcus agalactiae]